jgi:hypothetical protein
VQYRIEISATPEFEEIVRRRLWLAWTIGFSLFSWLVWALFEKQTEYIPLPIIGMVAGFILGRIFGYNRATYPFFLGYYVIGRLRRLT